MKKIITLSLLLFFFILIYGHYKFEFNNTESLPKGIYLISNNKIYKRNDIVVFCPPYNEFMQFAKKNGYWKNLVLVCDNITPKYMKKIVGIPGDNIDITFSGVYINNIKIKNSEAYKKILSDKIFNNYTQHLKLKDKEYFLMSDYNKLSYDSRYFGIVTEDKFLYKVNPFFLY